MSHHHAPSPRTQEQLIQERRALRWLIMILVPIGVWTLAALIWMWPGDISAHIQADSASFAVAGVTQPRGTITKVTEKSCDGTTGSVAGDTSRCAAVTVLLDDGPEAGTEMTVDLTSAVFASGVKPGQQLVLYRVPITDDAPSYQFADFERRVPLVFFAVLLVILVVGVARWRGFASMVGLLFAGFILLEFMFPALIEGQNPVWVGLVGSSAIMYVVLFLAHGFSTRTTTALVGTLFGLGLSATLGLIATRWAHLTGVASEDDFILAASAPDLMLTSVVVCGIIVAGLGVLNDVTITQASSVWELAHTQPSKRSLFISAMRIGRDHIASTVYTTAFASAGAVLPVLLLLTITQRPLLQVLPTEQFAGEVIRTLVGSIGLVAAVPLTTAIAVAAVSSSRASLVSDSIEGIAPGGRPHDELIDGDSAVDEGAAPARPGRRVDTGDYQRPE
ncbi:MAG TPA: YibE/F family protein [Propionibacteriaceae bacterium]|nr:YibE/F family protein [Propionibacteriaceae bacterium]